MIVGAAAQSSSTSPALTAAEGLDAGAEDRELLLAADPLRRPVNRPHASKVCPAESRCPGRLKCTRDWMPSFGR